MLKCYKEKKFSYISLDLIAKANHIIREYTGMGYKLTLRQLYYQFVSRDTIANTPQSYKRLGSIINNARLAGLISWRAIEDRTRNLESNSHWDDPAEIIDSAVESYRIDLWEEQPSRIEVWIEKEALAGIFDRVCKKYDVSYFCCRGYTSQSEMWKAGRRLKKYAALGFQPIILHFGDHDPSGIDMTRDITDRLTMFMENYGGDFEINRLALNMEQIKLYKPPPNPAKVTDSRCAGYIRRYGNKSWELDALEPKVLESLVSSAIKEHRDIVEWDKAVKKQKADIKKLEKAAEKIRENL